MGARLFPPGVPWSKRLFDLLASALLLLLLSPLLLALAALICVVQGRPVLFRQARPGYHGQIFQLYKFTTMRVLRDANGRLLPDAQRLTRLGRFLRVTSLDEWPELFCVLRGDMSLVGPRPLLVKYLPLYTPEQARRHSVLPGITGWAQIHGRNILSWQDKFRLDVWYVDHWTFWLDLRILAATVFKVIRREGVSAPGQATAREYDGTN
jgi:sugar transferase EpsL